MDIFRRPELANTIAQQLVNPGVLDEGLRSGLFLVGARHTGKTTFLNRDLMPALEKAGAFAIYADLRTDALVSPIELLRLAVKSKFIDSHPLSELRRAAGSCISDLDLLGVDGGFTFAQVFRQIVDLTRSSVVLILDEVQQAAITDAGQSMMLALKAARDSINTRPETPGYFLFIGAGSHPSHLKDMTQKRNQAFVGATTTYFPLLGKRYVLWAMDRLKSRLLGHNIPSQEVCKEAFEVLGYRPEYFSRALALTFRQKGDPDVVLPVVAQTLRYGLADFEIEQVEALGALAVELFDLIANSDAPMDKLFSVSSAEYYSIAIGRKVEVEEIQPVVNALVSLNLIARVGRGAYTVSDPEVGLVWCERKKLSNEGAGSMSNLNQAGLLTSELDFSASTKVDEAKVIRIYADMREKRSGVVKALQAMDNVEVIVGELPCGDYILSPEVAVERKSAVDFVSSVMSGRVFEQVGRMKLDFVRPMVLIEGDPIRTRSAIDPKSVAGAISSLMTIQQISVVSVADVTETAIMLATMARHLQQGLGYEINFHPKKPKPNKDAAAYVVSSLPGVGPGNAAKLVSHFGSIHGVMTASVAEIMGVKGIGPKTAQRIHELVHFV